MTCCIMKLGRVKGCITLFERKSRAIYIPSKDFIISSRVVIKYNIVGLKMIACTYHHLMTETKIHKCIGGKGPKFKDSNRTSMGCHRKG